MNKKLFLILFLGMFLFSFASASLDYSEENQTYEIDTIIPNWLGGDGYSNVTLLENTDQCLINCGFKLEGYNEQEVNILDDIEYLNKDGEDVSDNLKSISFQLGTYQEVEHYNETYETICEDVYNETIGNLTQSCSQNLISNETYYTTELIFEEYTGQEVSGYFQLKADAEKDLSSSMDWIITFRGKELSEWAWWNNNWNYKREINLTANAGKFSNLISVTYDAHMNSDFSDLRFLNSAEDTEFNYTIESYTASSSALIRVYSQGETSFYMYYGNSGATTTSDASATHFNSVAYYYLDETSGTTAYDSAGSYNGTNNGATPNVSGKINTAYSFDGVNDYINISSVSLTNTFTRVFWFKATATANGFLVSAGNSADNQPLLDTSINNGYIYSRSRSTSGSGGGGAYLQTTNTYSDGNWHFVVTTIDYSTQMIYLWVDYNGMSGEYLYTSVAGSYSNYNPANFNTLSVGAIIRTEVSGFLNGKIDEVGIWSRALSSTEISELYNYTSPTYVLGAEQQNNGSISIDYVTPPTLENGTSWSNTYIPVQVNVSYYNSIFRNITYNFYKGGVLNQSFFFTNETYFVNATSCLCDNWKYNVTACYTENVLNTSSCKSTETRIIYIDILPPEINITSPTGTYDYLYGSKELNFTGNITDNFAGLDTCWYEYNGTNKTIQNCNLTFPQELIYEPNENTLTVYANDSFGNLANEVIEWNYKVLENSRTLNTQSYETQSETFKINVTSNSSLTGVTLVYNGTEYTASSVLGEYTKTFDIPVGQIGNNSVKWKFTYAGDNFYSYESYQQVNETVFTICNATYTDVYLNLSFKDESTYDFIHASIPTSTFNYYLGSGTEYKTYSYINTSENYEYNFCATPNLTLNVDPYVQYKQRTYYPQRIWEPNVLSLTTTQLDKILYLLDSTYGIYTTFQVINSAEQGIFGVEVTAEEEIEGENVVIANGLTDSAGTITFWVNPDFTHTFNFTKTGYDFFQYITAPTQTSYTVTLTAKEAELSECARGVSYTITPTDDYLDQNSTYDFVFDISSTYWDLDNYTVSLYNRNGALLETQTGTNTEGETITFSDVDTEDYTQMYLVYSFATNGSVCLENQRVWWVQSVYGRDFSLKKLFTDLDSAFDNDLYGINGTSGEDNFGRILIVSLILIIGTGLTIQRYGIQSETMIIGIMASIVILLDFGFGLIPTITIGGHTLTQHFISIIALLSWIGFAIKGEQ